MIKRKKSRSLGPDDSGNVAIITAILLVVLIGLVALVVDVGHVKAVRNELQNAADAAALAGTRALFPPLSPGEVLIPVVDLPSCATAVTVATQTVNRADTQNLTILPVDVKVGHWGWPGETNWALNTFTAVSSCSLDVNGVTVTVRKDTAANQPLSTWFARIFGINTVDVVARATAAVGYVNEIPPRTAFPIAMSKIFRDNLLNSGTGELIFSPDNADSGGWCSPPDMHPNASTLRQWVDDGGIPEGLKITDQLGLQNGVDNSVLKEIEDVLPSHSQDHDGTLGWLVLMPVVDTDKFIQTAPLVDFNPFQPVIITGVKTTGPALEKGVYLKLYGNPVAIVGAGSGGPVSQLYATQPRLVGQIGSQF
jgi:hypothetical protein